MKKKLLLPVSALLLFALFAVPAFAADAPQSADNNLFSELYGFVTAHASELFSTLAFVGSLILAAAYKKGLLPVISRGMNALSKSVESIREQAVTHMQETDGSVTEAVRRLAETEKVLAALAARLDKLDSALSENASAGEKCDDMKTVMEAEIDMLYAIFMGSALPQYQKDMVGERVTKMKAALGGRADETTAS